MKNEVSEKSKLHIHSRNTFSDMTNYYFGNMGRNGKSVVFKAARSGFNPHLGRIVASLDKTLYDDIVTSNKQQIQWTII